MEIGEAITAMRGGHRVTRRGWNGPGQWLALSPGFSLPAGRIFSPAIRDHVAVAASGEPGVFKPYIMIKAVDGEFVPWIASQTDILAADWEIVPLT